MTWLRSPYLSSGCVWVRASCVHWFLPARRKRASADRCSHCSNPDEGLFSIQFYLNCKTFSFARKVLRRCFFLMVLVCVVMRVKYYYFVDSAEQKYSAFFSAATIQPAKRAIASAAMNIHKLAGKTRSNRCTCALVTASSIPISAAQK